MTKLLPSATSFTIGLPHVAVAPGSSGTIVFSALIDGRSRISFQANAARW